MPDEKEKQDIDYGTILAEWTFREFPLHSRGALWYFSAGLALILLLVYAVISGNFLFLVVIILSSALFFVLQKSAREIMFQIYEDGISIGGKFYSYSDIENFWIIYNPPEVKNLYFRFKSSFVPLVVIPLEDMNPVAVRSALLEYLEEDIEKEDEPTLDTISRLLKL